MHEGCMRGCVGYAPGMRPPGLPCLNGRWRGGMRGKMKEISRQTIILYCLPLFAVGLFTTMLNNYLIYFYQPTVSSGLPVLITQGYVFAGILTVIGLIKAVGHILDAVSDPLVASLSDKCGHGEGRRIPFLRMFALPFAVLNILPGSMMADVIRYDTIRTGINQEGTFAAAKSFVTKMGTSLATMIVPSLIVVGAATGQGVGRKGLLLTAVVGGTFTLASIAVYALYHEKEILDTIRGTKKG